MNIQKTSTAETFLTRLRADQSGVSVLELAFVLPILLTLGLYGAEIARMAMTRTQVSQIALSLADNASRLGQTDNSGVNPTVTEDDVDAIISGALRMGEGIDLENRARVILTSLEYDEFSERQYIHWQRCQGAMEIDSAYGDENDNNGLSGKEMEGMGRGSTKAKAAPGEAIMFVEVVYSYDAMFENPFGTGDKIIRQEAAYLIRDDRNLGPGLTGDDKNLCEDFEEDDDDSTTSPSR